MNALHTRGKPQTGPVPDLDLAVLRREFPVLGQVIHAKPLVYLDNASTTQKPRAVLDALAHYYESDNANVHRGVHTLGDRATAQNEQARHGYSGSSMPRPPMRSSSSAGRRRRSTS